MITGIIGFVGGLIVGWFFLKRPKFVEEFVRTHFPSIKVD